MTDERAKLYNNDDVTSFISKSTGIARENVRRVFEAYYELLTLLPVFDEGLEGSKTVVKLPYVGKFIFDKKDGLKVGDIKRTMIKDENGVMCGAKFIVEEDEPDYYAIKFKIPRSLKVDISKASIETIKKQKRRKSLSDAYKE